MEIFFFFFFKNLFILAEPGLSCGMHPLSCNMHAGSSSPTRDRTQAPCIGNAEFYPLGHEGSPFMEMFLVQFFAIVVWIKV